MEAFAKQLPKIELHAHISGSASKSTLEKLASRKDETLSKIIFDKSLYARGSDDALKITFQRFHEIHNLCNCEEDVKIVTEDVIREFAEDNVKYLELRTTPRIVKDTGMTRCSHITTALQAIKTSNDNSDLDITARLILSIDRRTDSEQVALETIKMASEFKTQTGLVVGIDLSGNPTAGDARTYLSALQYAKQEGLKCTLHLAESLGYLEETEVMLGLPPDRIGHGTHLHADKGGSHKVVQLTQSSSIPLEACMTSNLICQTVQAYDKHHFKFWYDLNHPISLATDDKGIFECSLSEEYYNAASAFALSKQQLYEISLNAIDHAFCDSHQKHSLKQNWKSWKKYNLCIFE